MSNGLESMIERLTEQLHPEPPELLTVVLWQFAAVEESAKLREGLTGSASTRLRPSSAGHRRNVGGSCDGYGRASDMTKTRARSRSAVRVGN